MRKKHIVIAILALLVTLAYGVSCYIDSCEKGIVKTAETYNGLPVKTCHASYSVNINKEEEIIGDADYYFLGKVVSCDSVEYKNIIELEQEDGSIMPCGDPYTNYTIQVYRNIKGELDTEKSIKVQKAGGISQDKSYYQIYEKDIFWEKGKYYIIAAYVQNDGSLLVSGANSSTEFMYNPITVGYRIKEYQGYYKNQVNTKRIRSKISREKIYKK